jgi:hypothetical protein
MGSGLGLLPPTGPPSLDGLNSQERVDAMVEWFAENFDDPAQETPYEGEYIYIWGGPYDAREEIEAAFPDATAQEVDDAVDEIQSDGLFEWAPAGIRVQPEDDSYVPDIEEPSLNERLANLESRLDVVELWLNAIEQPEAGIGHNQPPPEFRIAPDEQEIADLRESIAELRLELAKPDPANEADAEVVRRASGRFQRFLKWVKKVVIGGAVLFAASVVEGAGNEAWQDPHKFYEHVAAASETLTSWAIHIQAMF